MSQPNSIFEGYSTDKVKRRYTHSYSRVLHNICISGNDIEWCNPIGLKVSRIHKRRNISWPAHSNRYRADQTPVVFVAPWGPSRFLPNSVTFNCYSSLNIEVHVRQRNVGRTASTPNTPLPHQPSPFSVTPMKQAQSPFRGMSPAVQRQFFINNVPPGEYIPRCFWPCSLELI